MNGFEEENEEEEEERNSAKRIHWSEAKFVKW